MAKKKAPFDVVRELGRSLPDVEEGTAYGSPALKVGGRMFACMASHKSAEPDTLAVRVSFADRDELLAADPDTYYLKEHYVNYPCVLVRLGRVHRDALRDLLLMGWKFVAAKRREGTRIRSRRRRAALAAVAAILLIAPRGGHARAAAAASDVARLNQPFLLTAAEAQVWHAAKDSMGPALSGNASWKHYMTLVETKLREYGAVDVIRHAWTYDRWSTTEWPDDSAWTLTSDGRNVRVASYGANSGTTPEHGVTADLIFYDPSHPPASIAGKIVVVPTERETEQTPPERRVHIHPGDYLFLSSPETFPDPRVPTKVSHSITPRAEMGQHDRLIPTLVEGKAAGAIIVFDASYDRLKGLYTFGVPANHQLPTLYLDRHAGRQVIADARAGKKATLRLIGKIEPTETYQLIAYLPGRDYGTSKDERILMITHTDGPSISQEDGALGLLGIVKYFARVPKADRPRTLMVFLDNRHYMPGAERAFAKEHWLDQHPDAWPSIVASVSMEHLGQLEFEEKGDVFRPTGLVEHARLHAANNQTLIDGAIAAVKSTGVKRVTVECVDRPGIHGTRPDRWFGLGAVGHTRGLPAYALMGDMGAYWATSARLAAFDSRHFADEVATMTQLTANLMAADLAAIKPAAPSARGSRPQ